MLSSPAPPESDRRRRPSLAPLAVIAVLLVGAAAVLGVPDGDDGEGGEGGSLAQPVQEAQRGEMVDKGSPPREKPPPAGVSMQLTASDEVWVCVLDGAGQHLVNGQILYAGAEEGPFRSGSFTVSFGNGEVAMLVNGREAEIPATSSPIGYSIDSNGRLTELSETERPTCT